jgi:hypothetical protein
VDLNPLAGSVRAARAALLATPAVASAVLAHAAGGGCLSVLSVAFAGAFAWPAAVLLLGAHRSVVSVLVWLVGCQVVTHLVLEMACPSAPPMGLPGEQGGMAWWQMALGHGGTPMLAAHAAAAVVMALLFCAGDAAVWSAYHVRRAVAGAVRWVRTLMVPAVVVPEPADVGRFEVEDERARALWQVAPWWRRGPPVLLSV